MLGRTVGSAISVMLYCALSIVQITTMMEYGATVEAFFWHSGFHEFNYKYYFYYLDRK